VAITLSKTYGGRSLLQGACRCDLRGELVAKRYHARARLTYKFSDLCQGWSSRTEEVPERR